eukprot:jgi/Galph1/5619/GphlegSOOS_G4215.1
MGQQSSRLTSSHISSTESSPSETTNSEIVTVNPAPSTHKETHEKLENVHPLLMELEEYKPVVPLQEKESPNDILLLQETKQLADMAILRRRYSGKAVGLKALSAAAEGNTHLVFQSDHLDNIYQLKRSLVEHVISRQEKLQEKISCVAERAEKVGEKLNNKADQLRRVHTGIRQIEKLLITLCDCQELLTKSTEIASEVRVLLPSPMDKPICTFREFLQARESNFYSKNTSNDNISKELIS